MKVRLLAYLALFCFGVAHDHDHDHDHIREMAVPLEESFSLEPQHDEGHRRLGAAGDAYTLIGRLETECETEALRVGSLLADRYNSLDEATEWDVRIHNEFLTEHLGFAGWIGQGTWGSKGLTPDKKSAPMLQQRGGWSGAKNLAASNSSYWPLENQWLYMMGDSTQRQIWGSINSPLTSHEFERNAKEWSRENCAKQFPHRKRHPEGQWFPDEGWSGKCGNNEVTCHMSGFGTRGKLTFDWKHFPYEDYDDWVFGPSGLWSNDSTSTARVPDVLVVQTGLHSCFHAFNPGNGHLNQTYVDGHTEDIKRMMKAIKEAVSRPRASSPDAGVASPSSFNRTLVIFSTTGRIGNPSADLDRCIWSFNRVLVHEAHLLGFPVLEREEIERRLLFKSDFNPRLKLIKNGLHLAAPSPQIVATALNSLVGCMRAAVELKPTSKR